MNKLPEECPIPNPYVKERVIPDVLDAVDLIQEAEPGSSDLLPVLTGEIDILASMSGLNPAEALRNPKDLMSKLGCLSCASVDVCPVPRALESAAKIAEGSMYLNGLVAAASKPSNGNALAKAWLGGRMNAFSDKEAEEKDRMMTIAQELADQPIEAKEVLGVPTLYITMPERNGERKTVIIADTIGKVSKVLQGDGKVAAATADDLFRVMESIQNVGVDETIDSRFKAVNPDHKTKDSKTIFKTTRYTPGGYRLVIAKGDDEQGRTWILLADAVDHDAQDIALRSGPASLLHVKDTIAELVPPKKSDNK